MAIPPFPSQDLAKLVLGYLVEEQLMTAYDEFLNESPYLDAQKNEYDRVLMNSLRNILGEYRAVKIYVESCKPTALRRRLFQCSNLLEVVKYLVRYVDVKKLQEDLSRDRVSFDSHEATSSRIGCDACQSLKLESCVCSSKRRNVSSSKSMNNSESIEAAKSIAQSTSLSDLPGNQTLETKHTGVPAHHVNQSSVSIQQEVQTNINPAVNVDEDSIPGAQILPNTNITTLNKANVSGSRTALCSQNIAEFNTVLDQVYNNSNVTGILRDNNLVCTENTNNNRIPITGSFQDFTTGVRGASTTNVNIPDSSTTENVSTPLLEQDPNFQSGRNKKQAYQKKKCVFRVGNVKHDVTEISSEVIDVDSVDTPPKLKPEEQKVTIISNVKIGNDERLIPVPKNATSTPLLNMQTIYINGTRIFTPKPIIEKCLYTKDEIMAMPTIILGPFSGPTPTAPTGVQPQTVLAQSSNVTTSTCQTASCAPTLPPLTVEVPNTSSNVTCNVPVVNKSQEVTVQDITSQPGLVKTVETLKNASVPKDNIVTGSNPTSTPHSLPPQRKSSSTPRRTSHVRILDFTTPRRILNETINEHPNQETEFGHQDEVMISKSPNVSFPKGSRMVDDIGNLNTTIKADRINNTTSKTPEVNKSTKKKSSACRKTNWDADLRALVDGSEQAVNCIPPPKPKPKQTLVKKAIDEKEPAKIKSIANAAEKTRKKSSLKNNVSAKSKLSKKKEKLETATNSEKLEKVPSPTVSPIRIVSTAEKISVSEIEKNKDKSNEEEHIVTPELERLYLRNEIGAKLNISDILETPYKQALYEIQMETPRFLGPELPDDPMSDIKITDIPTPRFLSTNTPFTPKPTQATPSSYSSRPTDYSSGGSYYKPDDQDYFRIVDDVCAVTSTHSKDISMAPVTESATEPAPKESQSKRNRSRPVRQCTKNVSYYNSPMIGKNTDANNKDDLPCSDSVSANSSMDNALKDNIPTPRNERMKQSTRSSSKKNISLSKKRSPLKKVTQKPFMKIKPRRPTPTKDSGRINNRKSSESTQVSKSKVRMRNVSKDKVSGGSSLVVPAPTKSRRKSSTPRKLHCTKTFNSESSGHESPEAENKERPSSATQNSGVSCVQDSDTEQPPLRWSDDGSQDTKLQGAAESIRDNEGDELSKIKEYIHKTMTLSQRDNEGSLQHDLVIRGFDIETAKIIERDLLSTPVHMDDKTKLPTSVNETKSNKILEQSVESDCGSLANNLVINEDDDSDDFEFSAHECNESSANYFTVQHDSAEKGSGKDVPKLKDNFTMEVCMEGVVVRLRASSLNYLIDQDLQDGGKHNETLRETEMAVSSISNMDRLYTPMKDPIRAQCYEIFDSTLTSIDTPLKADSPKRKQDATVSEIILDGEDVEEKLEMKEKAENRKRKRLNCSSTSEESVTDNKRVKPETQLILQTKDIKNMDIEVLLTKLHGS